MHSIRSTFLIIAVTIVAGLSCGNTEAADSMNYGDILDKHRAALVTVKYVLSMNMNTSRSNRESESEQEQTCTMVSADGLLICSNNQLNGFITLIARMSGAAGGNMSSTPRDFEVLLSDQDRSFDAQIVAVDTELDMVWIRVTDPGDTTFSYIDFNSGTRANIGDEVFSIRRLGASFGREPMIRQVRIGAVTSKPRELFFLDIPMEQGAGLPVFSANGAAIGMIITQMPEPGGTQTGMSLMMGNAKALQDAIIGQILPASEVFKATQRALETLATE